ncbi:MAG TPA: hypothetical protein VFA55_10150 [Candidatus Kapabacteria bacterium]|nr:hypothetical protein [Candidatus Kapabacteria bacterium]
MRRILHTVLILAIAVQVNGTLFSVVLFTMNQRQIAAQLCERRTADCCGKCYLEKTIAKQDGGADRAAAKLVIVEPNIEAVIPSYTALHSPEQKNSFIPFVASRLLSGFPRPQTHPPQFV